MRKTLTLTLTVLAGLLSLTACGPAYVTGSQYNPGWNGDPCDRSYFDSIACQNAIALGGWYLNGLLIHHAYGGYGYSYYAQQNHVYVLHGGSVHPYSQSIRSVQSRPQQTQPASSVGSASKTYVPPVRNSSTPAGSASLASRPYTPPARSAPSSSYSAPSRSSSPSSSYSSPRRR